MSSYPFYITHFFFAFPDHLKTCMHLNSSCWIPESREHPLFHTKSVVCPFQFVAHPNCQQHLTSIWFGPEMGFMQSLALWKILCMWILCIPLVPFFCLIYVISPDSKVSDDWKCFCPSTFTTDWVLSGLFNLCNVQLLRCLICHQDFGDC